MRFLSTHRRHPLAGVLVLAFALVAFGGLYAAFAPSKEAAADSASSTKIAEGKKLFAVQCSSCHGLHAEGGSEGPPLIGVGAAAVDFQVSTGRMPAKQPGPQMQPKKPKFTAEETEALAAYVASLGPGPAIPAKDKYDTAGLTDAELAEGGELFRTNCTACHNFAGKGGALPWGKEAPPLTGASPKHIYEAMLTGPQQMPVFSNQVLTPDDKRNLIGYVKSIQETPNRGGIGLGRLGPVSEGLWGWLIGIGGLVVAATWIAAKGVKAK